MKISPAAFLPLSIAFVVLAVGITTSPCLRCYMFSEDIVQYWLAWLSLTSHPEIIGEHFTKPWFQCSNMGLFYRPVVQISYITDTLLYGRNTIGFHLTNFTCHVLSSVMCLLITRHLIINARKTADKVTATVTGAVAALLFGLNPLQLEPVYWLCCRCDALCTMLSLTSFYLSLVARDLTKSRGSRGLLMTLSVVAWLLALLAKEQAALLPLGLLLYCLMYPHTIESLKGTASAAPATSPAPSSDISAATSIAPKTSTAAADFKASLRAGVLFILPFLILLAIYSPLRLVILGGIGGYHGTIGALLNETLLGRFTSPTAWSKLFYPLDEQAFATLPGCALLYSVSYCLMGIASFGGWTANIFDAGRFKLIKFFVLSALIVQVAAYQSFIITESLFGSRCVYMAEAFTCMATAIVFMCFRPTKLRNILIPSYLALLAVTHAVNGSEWVSRGENLQAFQQGVNQWAARSGPGRKFCLLNMPLDAKEFSSLYDLEQLRCLLKPPANQLDNSLRAVQPTFLRMTTDAVNTARVKAFLDDENIDFVLSSVALKAPFALLNKSELQKHFAPIDTTVSFFPAKKPRQAEKEKNMGGFELDLGQTTYPQRADFIEVTVAPADQGSTQIGDLASLPVVRAPPVQRHPKDKTLVMLWCTDLQEIEPYLNWSTAPFVDDGKARTYVFSLGDRTSWKYSGRVLYTVVANLLVRYKIVNVRLKDASEFVPTLKCSPSPAGETDTTEADGFYAVNDKQSAVLSWDASMVKGAASTVLQISLPDFMYSLHSGGYREFELENHSCKTIKNSSVSGTTKLSRADFAQAGKYQTRVFACDIAGRVVGYCSDPVDLIVTDRPFVSALDKAIFNLRAQPDQPR